MTSRKTPALNPNNETPRPRSLVARVRCASRLAFGFLTVIPVPINGDETEADLAASRFAYPVVGAAIGVILAALSEVLWRGGAAPSISALLIVATGTLVSGGLHVDGLADSFDGLFLSGGPERRLAAMRDPHVGSFGVVAVVLVVLAKYAALVSLGGPRRSLVVLAAATVSRTMIVVTAGLANYARPEGTGRFVVDATRRRDAAAGALLAIVVAVALAGRAGLAAGFVTLVIAVGAARLAASKIGGVTGDVLGAVVELGDAAFLTLAGLS